ncbi:MAG: prepilin-type N-terminal cleavage/methylation domain-containing protein [Candidatus Omnitrophica bacterium]|nr:prepilin-type N-terminal cleavage/methylation domain-containing protein [Candidatus Omnitrophota bacterium]
MVQRKGFTLIELIMVIVIIAILAVIVIPRFINLRRDAQIAACAGTGAGINAALSHYYARRAIAGTAVFPGTLHDALFLTYIAEGTLPKHPHGWDWNSYYSTSGSMGSGVGPGRADVLVGQPPSSRGGACSGW